MLLRKDKSFESILYSGTRGCNPNFHVYPWRLTRFTEKMLGTRRLQKYINNESISDLPCDVVGVTKVVVGFEVVDARVNSKNIRKYNPYINISW